MDVVEQIISRVDEVLAQSIEKHRRHWASQSAHTNSIFDEIQFLVLGGGKRLRPQFCYWGFIAAGGDQSSDAPITLGAAIELVHAMALFHDDVIDDAATRRGKLTTHRRFTETHHQQSLLGEPRRFGEGVAILIGDVTSVIADELVSDVAPETRHIWNDLRLEMNIGQFLDTVGSAYRERSREFAETVCRNKSAKYTIERPLHLGAYAASVTRGQQLQPMLTAYGLPLGEAFQMRDDMLGAFGDESTVGKPVGGDFREGKPTPMLARAYEKANEAQRKILDRVGHGDITNAEISAIQEVVEETGIRQEMENVISSLTRDAVSALRQEQLSGDSYRALVNLADAASQRSV